MQEIKGQGWFVDRVAWHSKRSEIITSSEEGVSLNVYKGKGKIIERKKTIGI